MSVMGLSMVTLPMALWLFLVLMECNVDQQYTSPTMNHRIGPGAIATLGLVLIFVASIPTCALVLSLGWAWRLWTATTSNLMSFAISAQR